MCLFQWKLIKHTEKIYIFCIFNYILKENLSLANSYDLLIYALWQNY